MKNWLENEAYRDGRTGLTDAACEWFICALGYAAFGLILGLLGAAAWATYNTTHPFAACLDVQTNIMSCENLPEGSVFN